MIGKTTWQSNNSPLKDNSNSNLFYSYQKEPHSIYSKPERKKITLNYTSEEFSSWTIVKNWFQNIWDSLKDWLILKIYHWTFQENIYNKIKSWKSSKKTSSKNAWKCSQKFLKTLKTIKNSTNNSPKTLN